MMRLSRKLLLIVILILLLPSYLSSTTRGISVVSREGQSVFLYKDYHAIVIGVSNYDYWPKLPNAVNDAKEVGAKLEELGFKVNLITNPDSRKLKSTLTDIARRLGAEKNRALLFYFAGHGETTELADGTQLGYIIPRDCPLKRQDPMGFDDKAVSMKEIEVLALKVMSKHFLMAFDSCFSGSLFNLVRAAPMDISEKSARPVRQFITAGGAGEQVPDRSVFKIVFLDGIKGDADLNTDGYVTGSELGMHLQDKVVNYTRGGQHPQYGKINNPKLDKGDFVFERKDSKEKEKIANLEEESRQVAMELERLKRERERIELERKLGEERQKLEAERQRLEKEKQKLASLPKVNQSTSSKKVETHKRPKPLKEEKLEVAYVPKSVMSAKVSIRKEPKRFHEKSLDLMLLKYDFYDSRINPRGSFRNDFVDNGDGTVTDRATGLMWQQSGSKRSMYRNRVKSYVKELNNELFAGHSDWRLPTSVELASLLKEKGTKGLHLDPVFELRQKRCWSSDFAPNITMNQGYIYAAAWVANIAEGKISMARWRGRMKTGPSQNDINASNWVKVVRSVK